MDTLEQVAKETRLADFKTAVQPLVDYLRENHDPHTRVIVDSSSAELLSGEIAVPFGSED